MIIVAPKAEIVNMRSRDEILKNIEFVGRVAYKSEDRITSDSAPKFVAMLVKSGHWAVLEHESITVKFTTNRGVSHEIVRHRLASYCQESTRYCNYSKQDQITICRPSYLKDVLEEGEYGVDVLYNPENRGPNYDPIKDLEVRQYGRENSLGRSVITHNFSPAVKAQMFAWQIAQASYLRMIEEGCKAQQARGVLPNDVKTEIMVTMNLREWKHFLDLRSKGTTGAPHPDMKEVADMLYEKLHEILPEVFA